MVRGWATRASPFSIVPRDVEGTAFLSHTKILEPDDQWLFLPALKRVKAYQLRQQVRAVCGLGIRL